ncbi:hypothetical protein FOA52_011223 [Chlamydomonas sp. UWO 241]|nr:hypothetical protein FOA52_011223 [Chlamydomonas sp. UWO 241]
MLGALNFLVIGFGCFQADSGDYGAWLHKLNRVIARWQPSFQAGGCALSLQSVHGSHWVQVDVVGPPPMQEQQYKQQYQPQVAYPPDKSGYEPQPGYPPQQYQPQGYPQDYPQQQQQQQPYK